MNCYTIIWSFLLLLSSNYCLVLTDEICVVKTFTTNESHTVEVEINSQNNTLIVLLTDLTSSGREGNLQRSFSSQTYEGKDSLEIALPWSQESGEILACASFTTNFLLLDSIPLFAVIHPSTPLHFHVRISSLPTPEFVEFIVVPVFGIAEFYCGTSPWPDPAKSDTFFWTFDSSETNYKLPNNDTNFPVPSASDSAVLPFYCTTLTVKTEATIVFSFSSSGRNLLLIPGVPFEGSLQSEASNHYDVKVFGDDHCDLFTIVTVISGDPDLWMSKNTERPTGENNEEGDSVSEHWGSDYIMYANASGTYHISVVASAFLDAEYQINCMIRCPDEQQVSTLINGRGQVDIIMATQERIYYFTVGNKSEDIAINVVPLYGDPDMKIKLRSENMSANTDWLWVSNQWGADFIKISAEDEKLCNSCELVIQITAYTDSIYTITASSSGHEVLLRNGVSATGFCDRKKPAFYEVVVKETDDLEVMITTMTYGDIYLWVSSVDKYPNITNHEYSKHYHDGMHFTLSSAKPGHYFLGVGCNDSHAFDILAIAGGLIQMENGVSQIGNVEFGTRKNFELMVQQQHHTNAIFTLSVLTGGADLYVSTKEVVSVGDWSSDYMADLEKGKTVKVLEMSWDSIRSCETVTEHGNICHYWITVLGTQNGTQFSLLVTTDEAIVTLQSGQSIRGDVSESYWNYFQISSTEVGQQLDVQITNTRGDADMYISTINQRPNITSHMWAAEAVGDDNWHIDHCTYPGTYFIGVTACSKTDCTNSSFSITATLDFDSRPGVILLLHGVSQDGHIYGFLLRDEWKYYEIRVPYSGIQVKKLDISVTYALFSPDVFVGRNISLLPNRENYEWKFTQNSDCLISIKQPEPGRYFIAITSSWPSTFTITGSLDETLIELQDGTPFYSSLIRDTWQYFSFSIQGKKDLTFMVTVMTGDTDLYISVDSRPTAHNYTWRAISWGSDAVFIPQSDEHACSICVYILGVYAFVDSSFTVAGSYQRMIELSDGTPNHGILVFRMMKYYSFRAVNATATITISATIISGRLELYVNNGTIKPTRADFKYSSIHFTYVTGEIIIIDHEPCLGVFQCIYTILVYAGWDVEYNLVAKSGHSTRILQNSVPVAVALRTEEWSFYSYHQMEISDLQVVMTPISGQPKLFVRRGERPTTQDRDYGPVEGAGQITILAAEPEFYYVGVYSGDSDSTFSISAISQTAGNRSENEKGINLVDGVSSYGSVVKNGFAYYTFAAGPSDTEQPKNASFSVTVLRGSPEMYIKHFTQPSQDSYDYKITEFMTSFQIKDAVPVNSKAIWNIGLYGKNSEADFYVTAIIQDSVQVLQQGVPTTGNLKAGESAYFIIESKAATKDIYIHVVAIVGKPTVYVSKYFSMPNASCHDWTSFDDALGVSVIVPYVNITAHSSLHMTLEAGASDAYFQVVVYYQELLPLIEGSSQQFELGSDLSRIFVWRVPETQEEDKSLLISVSPIMGDIKIWVGVWTRPKIGDPTTYQWSSDQQGLTIHIEETDKYYNRPAIYYTNVQCQMESEKCQFYILVQSGGGSYQLQVGAPVTAVTRVGQYQYYSMMVDDKNLEDVSITLTEILGRTALYGSLNVKRPTSENFQWESNDGALTISKNDPAFVHKGIYYFSVKGLETENEFSIVAGQQLAGRSMKPIILSLERKQTAIIDSIGLKMSENLYTYRTDSKRDPDKLCFQIQILQGKLTLYYHNDGTTPSKEHTIKEFGQETDDFLIPITDPCGTCEYLILIQAQPDTIYSLTVKKFKAEESSTKRQGYSKYLVMLMFIACILTIFTALAVVCYCVRKQNRLRRELHLTELELNQHGVEGPRQRREEDQRRGRQGGTSRNKGNVYEALVLDREGDQTSPTDITPMLK